MTSFNLAQLSYIALARRSDLTVPTTIQAAVYAPGLICADRSGHHDGAALLYYAYLIPWQGEWGLLGSTCLQRHSHHAQPNLWQTVLDNRHPLVGMGLADHWRTRTHRQYWQVVPLIGMMIQVEPRKNTRGMLMGYLRRITRRKGHLTAKQKQTLLDILRERGSEKVTPWSTERQEHYRILKARRDLAFRLARLAALDLSPQDTETVQSLRQRNTSWHRGRMRRLSEKQVGLVRALESQYLRQRVAAMEVLIRQLTTMLALNDP